MNGIYHRKKMRKTMIGVLAFVSCLPMAFAQEWKEYRNQHDGFAAQFPSASDPRIIESTWESESGFKLPARIYLVERGAERYSVTVADYTSIQALGRARLKSCPEATDETCNGTPLSGEGYWKHDLRGAMLWATKRLIARDDVQVKDIGWNQISRISTISMSFASPRAGTKTYALVTMNERRLYVVEGIVPAKAVFPLQFGGSFAIFSSDPKAPRQPAEGGFPYPSLYSNEIYGVGDIPLPPPSDTPPSAGPYLPHEYDNVPVPSYPPPKGIASDGRPIGQARPGATPPQRKARPN